MIEIRLPRLFRRAYYPTSFLGMEWEPMKSCFWTFWGMLGWEVDKKFSFRTIEECQKECDRRNRLGE